MIKKKIITLTLAAAMLLSTTGCSGEQTKNIATYTGGEIPAGVYIYTQISNLNELSYYLGAEGLLEKTLGEKTVEVMVTEAANEGVKRFAAVESEFARLGLTLDEARVSTLTSQLERAWEEEGKIMEQKGVALDSYKAVGINNLKAEALFDAYYKEGGERAVSDAERETYYKENFRRVMLLQIPKQLDGTQLEGDALAKIETEIDGYFKSVQDGKPLFDVIKEYMASIEQPLPTDAKEGDFIGVIPKTGSDFPTLFVDKLFAATEMNKVDRYDNTDFEVIYEPRELMEDRDLYESYKETLITEMKGEEFRTKLLETADTISFTMNDAAVKKFTPAALLKR